MFEAVAERLSTVAIVEGARVKVMSKKPSAPREISRALLVLCCAASLSSCVAARNVEVGIETGFSVARGVVSGGTETARQLVSRLDFRRFRSNVGRLARFGSRYYSNEGNIEAGNWIEDRLRSYGYEVERHAYEYRGVTRENIYATIIGVDHPGKMYIVSAHMDSFNTEDRSGEFAPGADDDASGTALVLEAARVFATPNIETAVSVRFILWNNEETGLNGSRAYAQDRQFLQGIEDPPGSGLYPEPEWLGIIQHDMILFDHGLPPGPRQIPEADIDIEYHADHSAAGRSAHLAAALLSANANYSANYPAEVGARMTNTDSTAFWDMCPAVSVRENERLSEIGKGANPQWHKSSDVAATYSEADFLLGFNAIQMTVGAVAELSGARLR